MRTFKLQVQTTVDGYMAGPEGQMDWMTMPWSDDLSTYADALTKPVDTMVLGRKLAEGFIPTWAARPDYEDAATIDWMNDTPKVVVSCSLATSPWDGAVVAGGDLATTVAELKARPGGDLITYGGVTLAHALIAAELLDELHLFVNPTAIGTGRPVFPPGARTKLRLVDAHPFRCGVTALHYEPRRD